MGTKLTGVRQDIYQEETDYRSAISENLMTKLGQGINFINDNQLQTFNFRFLGPFGSLSGGEDGVLVFPYNIEVVGYSGHIRLAPVSGGTILGIDFHKLNSSGTDQGTILENSIQIATTASNNAMFYKNTLTSTESVTTGIGGGGGGSTDLPNITSSTFSAGEGLRIDLDGVTSGTGQEDLSVNVWCRPV